jgi:hypothetical protein
LLDTSVRMFDNLSSLFVAGKPCIAKKTRSGAIVVVENDERGRVCNGAYVSRSLLQMNDNWMIDPCRRAMRAELSWSPTLAAFSSTLAHPSQKPTIVTRPSEGGSGYETNAYPR